MLAEPTYADSLRSYLSASKGNYAVLNDISCSARFFAMRKSRLSIIAAVRSRWLTFDPLRGNQGLPAWRS
ncbi:hypothetical protein ABIB90_006405 [Bradyrhizobium sp. JR4.1]